MCTHWNAERVGGPTRAGLSTHVEVEADYTAMRTMPLLGYAAHVFANLKRERTWRNTQWSLLHLHHPLGEVEMPQTNPPRPVCKRCISTFRPEKLIWPFHYSVLLLLYEFGLVGSHTCLAMCSHVRTSALQLHLLVSFYFVPTSSYSLSTRSLIPVSRVRCMRKWHPRTPSITCRFVPPSHPYRCRGDTQEDHHLVHSFSSMKSFDLLTFILLLQHQRLDLVSAQSTIYGGTDVGAGASATGGAGAGGGVQILPTSLNGPGNL